MPNESQEELQDASEAPKKGPGRPKLVPNENGMVEVKKSALDALLARVDRLESAASKAGLSKYDDKHKEDKGKKLYLRTFEGLVVLSWDDMVEDIVEKNGNGQWREEQTIRIFTEDGKDRVMPYTVFVRRYQYIKAEVLSETKHLKAEDIEKHGHQMFRVRTHDGDKMNEYDIGSKFVN